MRWHQDSKFAKIALRHLFGEIELTEASTIIEYGTKTTYVCKNCQQSNTYTLMEEDIRQSSITRYVTAIVDHGIIIN